MAWPSAVLRLELIVSRAFILAAGGRESRALSVWSSFGPAEPGVSLLPLEKLLRDLPSPRRASERMLSLLLCCFVFSLTTSLRRMLTCAYGAGALLSISGSVSSRSSESVCGGSLVSMTVGVWSCVPLHLISAMAGSTTGGGLRSRARDLRSSSAKGDGGHEGFSL